MVDWRITLLGLLSQAESSSTTCLNYDDATIAEKIYNILPARIHN